MGILRALGSRALACGCLAGVYETYDSQTVAIIDARGSDCVNAGHRVDSPIDFQRLDLMPEPPPIDTHPRPKL